jgi:hypothetical protein
MYIALTGLSVFCPVKNGNSAKQGYGFSDLKKREQPI